MAGAEGAMAGARAPGLLVLPSGARGRPGCFRRQPEALRQVCCRRGRLAALERSGLLLLCGREAGSEKCVRLKGQEEVRCVDCEETHLLLLSADGKLSEHRAKASSSRFETRPLIELGTRHIVQIACGDHHSMALSRGGELFAWGQNAHGQLGVGRQLGSTREPQLVQGLKGVALAQVAAGGAHSLALSVSGAVYSWGKNACGQLGLGHTEDRDCPSYVGALQHWKTVFISCGADHTAVLSKDGLVCTFGAGEAGQLGHNSTRNEQTPRVVAELWGARVSQVACGSRHTLVYVPTLGKVYSFGSGEEGQLGNEDHSNQLIPLPINLPVENRKHNQGNNTSQKEIKIIAGGNQSIVLLLKKNNCYVNLEGIATVKDAWISDSHPQKWRDTKTLSLIFSSEACINGSFLEKRWDKHFRTSKEVSGVNLSAVLCLHKKISCKPEILQEVRMCYRNRCYTNTTDLGTCVSLPCVSQVKQNIMKLLLSLSPSPISPENFRIYLILPFLLRRDDETSFHCLSLLAEAIMKLQAKDLLTLESLWSNLEPCFFEELVSTYQRASRNSLFQYIVEVVHAQRKLSDLHCRERANLRLLQILFQVNSRAGFGMAPNNFYIPEVKDLIYFNPCEDVKKLAVWKLTKYPCIFDMQNKIAVHNLECNTLSMRSSFNIVNPVLVEQTVWPFVVRRQHLLHDIWHNLKNAQPENFASILEVTFAGEAGVDQGGLSQELFSVAARALRGPRDGPFVPSESQLLWFPRQAPGDTFLLVGTLLGMALHNACTAPLPFPRALYKKLLRQPPTLDDLKELRPAEGRNLQKNILDEERDDAIRGLNMYFSTVEEEGDSIVEVQLKENGANIAVTKQNRKEFVDLYVNYVFNESVKKPFEDFRRGFSRGCPTKKWKMFLPGELQTVLEGHVNCDWHWLEKNVKYIHYQKSDQTIKNFWNVFHRLPEEKKKMFLAFLSGSDRIPATGLEYFVFYIADPKMEDPDTYYPFTNTCSLILSLPRYSSRAILQERLLGAIMHCEKFGLQ